MSLYTRKGDSGKTSLYDSTKFQKSHPIFEVLGEVDKLSSDIGLVCAFIPENKNSELHFLRKLQSKMLDIGSDFATLHEKKREKIPKIVQEDIVELENLIDKYTDSVPPLKEFILPGKNGADSYCHVCRITCRSLERKMWFLKEKYAEVCKPDLETFKFINRLSDYFFALARYITDGQDITRSIAKDTYI
jgi:cob(I)alamin adenosyltransferase